MKNFNRALAFIILLATVIATLPSCAMFDEKSDVAVFYNKDNKEVCELRTEMDLALGRLNISYKNHITNDKDTQIKQIDTAIKNGVKAIAVCVATDFNVSTAEKIVQMGQKADIGVIFFGNEVEGRKIKQYDKCVYVGTNEEIGKHIQYELIGAYLDANSSKTDLNKDGITSYLMLRHSDKKDKNGTQLLHELVEKNGQRIEFYDKENIDGYIKVEKNNLKDTIEKILKEDSSKIELIITESDDIALNTISILEEMRLQGTEKIKIPIFGIGGTEGAEEKIRAGHLTATVKIDNEVIAQTIAQIIKNTMLGANKLTGIDKSIIYNESIVYIPYYPMVSEDF
jgi:ABC-type sugar transport system substrate-binding protein